MPSPEIQKRPEKYQTFDEIEAKALKLEWRRAKRRRNRLVGAVAGLALVGTGISAYAGDVHSNQEVQATASIGVHVEGPALDKTNDHNALVFIDGLGSYNSNTLTKYMGQAVQPLVDGQLWSVDYNNAPLETEEIAKQIISTASEQGVSSLSFVGYSAGGDIAMQVQEEVRKESSLNVQSIFLVSTPDGADALRPARQDALNLVEKFAWIPGIRYSTPLRFLGELAVRADRYNSSNPIENVRRFFETAGEVTKVLSNRKLTGTWLMFDQMLAIENADLKARIETMKNIPKDQIHPTLIYLGTAKPGYDDMIDNKKSSAKIAEYARKSGTPFLSYDVPGAVHTRIDIANDQYIKILADAKIDIQSSIEKQKSIASLNRVMLAYSPYNPGVTSQD